MPRLEKLILRDDQPAPSWTTRVTKTWESIRGIWLGPYDIKDPGLAGLFGGVPSQSGMAVNEWTALATSTFFCAVTTIAADIASLPLQLYKRLPNGGKTKFPQHPLYTLLHDAPNPESTSYKLRESLMLSTLAWGNGYLEVERDAGNRPLALWFIEPQRVIPFRAGPQAPQQYRIRNPSGIETIIDAPNMVHLRGPSLDGCVGLDVIHLAREALGLSLAAERFGAKFFSNGAMMGGLLTPAANLSDRARENLRNALNMRHQGADRAHQILLLEPGTTYTATAGSARDSQFTEIRHAQLGEIARFFKIPTSLLGDLSRATWSNYEQQALSYYRQCIAPWLENIEQELSSKLIASSEKNLQVIEHNVSGFLKADAEKRSQFYSTMLQNGAMSVNEVRELENLPPIPGGDIPRVPMNSEPLRSTARARTAQRHAEEEDPYVSR